MLVLANLFFFAACRVSLVSDYDAAVASAIIETAESVDAFYGRLLEAPEEERSYQKFQDQYITIEVKLRALVMRNKIRPLNEESVKIAETTLEKWLKYKVKHKETGGYKDVLAEMHRKRFIRLFTAMAIAEEGKKLGEVPDD